MLTDYKFWYIQQTDEGVIFKTAVRFFEGEVTTLDEVDETDTKKPVKRYRRSSRLKAKDLTHLGAKFETERNGSEVVIYTQEDFGIIKTFDELRLFVNNQLDKDPSRMSVDNQKELLDKAKVQ